MSTNFFQVALKHGSRVAVRDPLRKHQFTYNDLLYHANALSQQINARILDKDKHGAFPPRINLLVPPSFEHISSTYAIWGSGCVSVPLCSSHPVEEMRYYVQASQPVSESVR